MFPTDSLDAVLDLIDLDAPDRAHDPTTWDGPNHLIHLRADGYGLDVGLAALDGHPSAALLGTVAPEEWLALGTLAYGWVRPLAEGPSPGGPERTRCRVLTLVDRQGRVASRLRKSSGSMLNEAPTEGLVLECLQRSLGLPTAPPPEPTDSLFSALWLEAVCFEATRRGHALDWAEVSSLHPAAQLAGASDGDRLTVDAVLALAEALGRVVPWTEARWLTISTGWLAEVADPAVAAWMDDGMYSRTALHQHPLAEALERSGPAVTAQAWGRLNRVLGHLHEGGQAA